MKLSDSRAALLRSFLIMGMRGLALVGRFALTIYIVRYLNVEAVGVFGLLAGALAILPVVLGFGLSFRLNREIIGLPLGIAALRIRDRLAVTIIAFIILVIGTYLSASLSLFPEIANLWIIVCIFFLEIIAFDMHMYLISLKMPVLANSILFIRSASWIFIYIAVGFIFPEVRKFSYLLIFWLFGLLSAVAILCLHFRKFSWKIIYATPVDINLLKTRFHDIGLIYVSDLALVGASFLDRFILNYFSGVTTAGIFIFYWSLTNGVYLLVYTGMVQMVLPKLMDIMRKKNKLEFIEVMISESTKALLSSLTISGIVFLFALNLVPLLGKTELAGHQLLFVCCIVAFMVRLVSEIVNYGICACHYDRSWAVINLISVCLSTVYTIVGILEFGLNGVGFAMIATSVTVLGIRIYCLRRELAVWMDVHLSHLQR